MDHIEAELAEIKQIVRADHDMLQRMDQLVCGNGQKGLAARYDRLEKIVTNIRIEMAKTAVIVSSIVSVVGAVTVALIMSYLGL